MLTKVSIPSHTDKLDPMDESGMTYVCFVLCADIGRIAKEAYLVGEFNGWNETSHPMARREDDSMNCVLELTKGKKFQYRFLVFTLDGKREWHNDWHADGYVDNPYWGDNSVVHT